jgi:hypothetical protein
MSNILNKDGLDALFDVDSDHESFFENIEVEDLLEEEETELAEVEEEPEVDEEDYFLENIKELMEDVKGIIGAAKYLCDSSPEPETIMAASSMFTSASQLLKELNKSAMQLKRFKFMNEHEKMKIKARMDLAMYKAEQNKKLIMQNSTINIQNNHLSDQVAEFSQESIVKEILAQNKQIESKQDFDMD